MIKKFYKNISILFQKIFRPRIRGMVPCRSIGGAFACVVPFSGEEFTMYQMTMPNWIAHPVLAKMAPDGFYDLTGSPRAVWGVIADQRKITGENLCSYITRFMLPLTLRGWFGVKIVCLCIFRNLRFWSIWTPAILRHLRARLIASAKSTAFRLINPHSRKGNRTMKIFLIIALPVLLSSCAPQAGNYYPAQQPADQMLQVGQTLIRTDRGW